MEEFRKTFKEKNPNNKSVAVVTREDKWKSLTEEEKAPYIAKAAKLKADYTKTMAAYNKGQSGGGGGSRAVAADEEEEEEEEEEGEESD
ncbi:DNA-binding protein MNB1B-like [Zingiber officinale]|uniref:DNA-binding protein MNB1B-like n=1 Tax=Zingiber officinale TaxID=94328 RepID=UPI001C4D23CB|nr:DNA-binding protein MNB1B-like [Zingiber officinale]